MDGSPSASVSNSGTTPSPLSDAERELNDLRARAYGPHPDIEADPSAMARLIELEAAHVSATMPVTVTESVGSSAVDAAPVSPLLRESGATGSAASAKPTIPTISSTSFGRRTWFLIGAIVSIAIVVFAATWLRAPHADATLQPIAGETDDAVITALPGEIEVGDISTLHQFERYHDLDVWSVETSSGDTCLIAWNKVGMGRFQFECGPPGTDPVVHMSVVAEPDDGFGDWLPTGSVVSLHLGENTVDVFVHPPPAAT